MIPFLRVPSMTKDDWEYLVIFLAPLNFDQKKRAHHDSAVLACFRIPRLQRPPMIFRSALVHSHPHPGVIDLRVEIHTSEINEYLFFFSLMISNNQKEYKYPWKMLFCEIYRDYRLAKRGLSIIWPYNCFVWNSSTWQSCIIHSFWPLGSLVY